MCTRLIRLFKALHAPKSGISNVQDGCINSQFAPDETLVQEIVEERWPNSSHTLESSNECEKDPLPTNTHDVRTKELMHALIHAEQFMRTSIKSLEILRAVEPDVRKFTYKTEPALGWLYQAFDVGIRIKLVFVENPQLEDLIIKRSISLPPALAKFVELLSLVRHSHYLWLRKHSEYWSWPGAKTESMWQSWDDCCPYIDVVRELEEVQKLLLKQNASSDRLRNANFATARDRVNEAFSVSSKVLAIRLDLGFKKKAYISLTATINEGQNDPKLTDLDIFITHLTSLTKLINKDYHNSRLAYIFKIEYGLDKGYHAHLLLLLNGHKHQQDINLAKCLGEKWEKEITLGTGVYWNCNANKEKYRYKAIGMIHRDDQEKRELLIKKVVTYLVKYDLPIELLKEKKFRKFRASAKRLK